MTQMAYKWRLLTTAANWDDPPSREQLLLKALRSTKKKQTARDFPLNPGCLIGILIVCYHNLTKLGSNPLIYPKQAVFSLLT